MIEDELLRRGANLSPKGRFAKRRKPNAFHWLDENWDPIATVFIQAIATSFAPRRPRPAIVMNPAQVSHNRGHITLAPASLIAQSARPCRCPGQEAPSRRMR
jgi:hypothetical protein